MTVYTLFQQAATGQGAAADASAYTLGAEFAVSGSLYLDAIWFSSPSGSVVLPQTIALFSTAGTLLHSETVSSWSGAAASGWVKAAFSSPPAVSGAGYVAAVLQNTTANWYSGTGAYWTSGPGSGGITDGPLSAPNNGGSANGQNQYHVGATLTFPVNSNGSNYWVDPEVTTSLPGPVSGPAYTACMSSM